MIPRIRVVFRGKLEGTIGKNDAKHNPRLEPSIHAVCTHFMRLFIGYLFFFPGRWLHDNKRLTGFHLSNFSLKTAYICRTFADAVSKLQPKSGAFPGTKYEQILKAIDGFTAPELITSDPRSSHFVELQLRGEEKNKLLFRIAQYVH